jgi:hypothetical protein
VVQAEESTHDGYPAESGACYGRHHLEANVRKVVLSVDIAGNGWFVDRRTIVNGGLGFCWCRSLPGGKSQHLSLFHTRLNIVNLNRDLDHDRYSHSLED